MPDVASHEEYMGYLERLANQTHPEILPDNIEILRSEVDKHDQHLEEIDDNRQAVFRSSVTNLGGVAVGTLVGEAAVLSAKALLTIPHEPDSKFAVVAGVITLGVFGAKELITNVRNNRHYKQEKVQRDHIEFLTQKAQAGVTDS